MDLNDLWKQAVYIRDKGICRKCGLPGTDAHHIKTRGRMSVKWDIDNGILLCRECHDSAKYHPKEFSYWIRDEIDYDKLLRKSEELSFSVDEEEIKKKLYAIIKKGTARVT